MAKRGFIRSNWLYRKLNMIQTTLIILGLMAFTMILGTVFPQEMSEARYISSWGESLYNTYNALGLLAIFKSAWFLSLMYALVLNIVVCTYERYLSMRSRRKLKKDSMGQVFVHKGETREYVSPLSYGDLTGRIHNVLGVEKFKIKKRHASDNLSQLIVTKGTPYLLMSILFHLGILLCVIGFVQTYLDNYEGYVALYPDKVETIDTVGKDTRLYQVLKTFQKPLKSYFGFDFDGYVEEKKDQIKLKMEGFYTEYSWYNEGYYPKDWKSDIILYNKYGEEVVRRMIEVNDPIYYEGYAFYQVGYDQSCDLHIKGLAEPIKAKPNENFTIEGHEGEFMIGTIRNGKLFYRFKDGSTDIVPNVKLYHFAPVPEPKEGEKPTKPKREEIGELVVDQETTIKGIDMRFDNFVEGTYVSFRRDAGVPMLWFASILLMIAICIRIYLPYYKIRIQIEHAEGGKSKAIVGGNSLGLTADLSKQIDKILQACF